MNWWDICKKELKAIFKNPAILLTVFGGVIFYSFLYPLPYSEQIPRELKVVVVNLDNSQMSRTLERMVDATPQVQLVARAHSLAEAQSDFVLKKLAGILVIPENFYLDLLQNKRPTLSFAGDASYFLVYGTVLEGMASAGQTLAAQVKVTRMVMSGQSMVLAAEQYSAIKLNIFSAFNETLGYVNYVIPAIFILILHHTLLMGAGILGGGQNEELATGTVDCYWLKAPVWKLLCVRTVIFMTIYWLLCMYYFGFVFEFYSIPHLADFHQLNLFILPFLLSTSFLGILLGLLLPRRELATLLVLLSSMPMVFASGFVWPTSAVPGGITQIIQLIPVIPAINGFLRLNQMGAAFGDILSLWNQLWLCAGLYGSLCCLLLWNKKRKFQ
ncbi:ABC transporter permease [Desulforhopalus sp. IMCC35007]|uniref:ABC transporter permease n=1 Tax=Desulforhopalus sp. IMCC35007 TaxID=2569543 RepID=UPI0010AEA3EA|nr:ABC transporter permease [Desulforhopalus sp. IMCC35007]TKB09898.1 ABC transporter permease [Desulforhopalus sp. IMCC35007]